MFYNPNTFLNKLCLNLYHKYYYFLLSLKINLWLNKLHASVLWCMKNHLIIKFCFGPFDSGANLHTFD